MFSLFNLNCWLLPLGLSKHNLKRLKEIIEQIKNINPDIICLQEIWLNRYLRILKKELPEYQMITSGTLLYNQSGLVILSKKKPVRSSCEFFELTTLHNFTELFFHKGYLRAEYELGGFTLNIINTHLYAPFSSIAKRLPRKQFDKIIRSESKSDVICGDLNMEPQEFILPFGYISICPEAPTFSRRNIYSGKIFSRQKADRKLDYVLIKAENIKEDNCEVRGDIVVSDHYPISVNLSFK